MIYAAKQKSVVLKDTTLQYIRFGKGARPLVMIQGLNTNGIDGAAEVQRRHRMLALDLFRTAVAADDEIPPLQLRQIPADGGQAHKKLLA